LEKFDVTVVGAGTAGCIAAKTLASAGFKVCLVDRKEARSIGDKVCGDAIGKHHFDNLDLTYPKGDELEGVISGVKIYSPDLETVFHISGEGLTGFMVNRYIFGQRILKEAVNAGAVLVDSTHVLEPIIENGFVKGVRAKRVKDNSKTILRGEVTVDASGVSATLRSKMPLEMGITQRISPEDLAICYREIRELREEVSEPDILKIYLDLKVAPGGYYWIFPKKGLKVNVGLGVAAVKGSPNPKGQFYGHVLSLPLFEGSKALHGGGGYVPTRRPLDSFVGNGIVVIGDAACQANPIHGGGIGPSMTGGKIAGEVISKVLEASDPTVENLWPINVRYMRAYGSKQAGLDVFRLFLQSLANEDLNYGMKYRLIKEEDVLAASMGDDIHLNITDVVTRVFKGLGRLTLLRRLRKMAEKSKRVKALYGKYPEKPEELPSWKVEVDKIFGKE